jgi:ESCRT-I complex subunit VPS37
MPECDDNLIQRFTPQFLLMRLRHSITAQDDASEALASSFIHQTPHTTSGGTGTPSGDMGVDDFIKEFKELRNVYHKRVMSAEKWTNGQVVWRDD